MNLNKGNIESGDAPTSGANSDGDRASRPSVHAHARGGAHARLHADTARARTHRDSLQESTAEPKRDFKREPKPHKQNFIARAVNQWFDRVMGAMKGEGLEAAPAQYASHKTTRDFVWNTIGSASWACVFPVVTMVSTQFVGVEQAGMISMAFVVGILLMFLGNFGVRTYQVSDTTMEHSFKDYQANRWATCALMLAVGWLYCSMRGYSEEMFNISIAIILYKFIDALADVYEGRLQQVDKLYLAGVSQTFRSLLALAVFAVILFVTRNAVWACYAMAIAATVTFVVITWPLTLMEAPPSQPFVFRSFVELFKVCAPLFLAIFLFNVIENMPKFVMEGMLPYENQLYYNAIYFPAQMILICAQLVYKPLLLRMAGVWQDASARLKFDLIMLGIVAVIAAITGVACAIMAWVGIPVLNFLYGINFAQFRGLLFLMLITGGITAAIDFLYQVITIMRRQKDVTVLYFVTFGFSLFIPFLLVRYAELEGAVLSYVIIEAILFVLLVWEYLRIRRALSAEADAPPAHGMAAGAHTGAHAGKDAERGLDGDDGAKEDAQVRKLRPSEIRAERERRAEIIRRRTGGK